MAFLPLIYIAAMIPVSISGWGVRESVFVYFYGLIGVDPTTAFSVSVVNYMILSMVPACVGGIISIVSHVGKREIMQIDSSASPF
jgi:uncharacterized membrane protein YbhN (UPF0104 family)